MSNYFKKSYDILSDILKNKAYINIALSNYLEEGDKDNSIITKIVYGVVEKDNELEIKINKFLTSKPKPNVMIIFKISLYCSLYMDSIPPYAIVDNAVKLAKTINRGFYVKLVNAVTRKFVKGDIEKDNKISCPDWLRECLIHQYGEERAKQILNIKKENPEHIRNNIRKISFDELIKNLKDKNIDFTISDVNGIFVKKNEYINELFAKGIITFQSPSSMLVVKALNIVDGSKVLDVCSAPGGKAVYLSELYPHSVITACDIHPHRIFLIEKYAKRMESNNIETCLIDATRLNNNYINYYDAVLCDVPCSGTGVFHKKPDILLNKSDLNLNNIVDLQYKILSTSAKYVKKNGILMYSTCSIIKDENDGVTEKFLNENSDFRLEKMNINIKNNGSVQLLPDDKWDGFYMAQMRRI